VVVFLIAAFSVRFEEAVVAETSAGGRDHSWPRGDSPDSDRRARGTV